MQRVRRRGSEGTYRRDGEMSESAEGGIERLVDTESETERGEER